MTANWLRSMAKFNDLWESHVLRNKLEEASNFPWTHEEANIIKSIDMKLTNCAPRPGVDVMTWETTENQFSSSIIHRSIGTFLRFHFHCCDFFLFPSTQFWLIDLLLLFFLLFKLIARHTLLQLIAGFHSKIELERETLNKQNSNYNFLLSMRARASNAGSRLSVAFC